jgi:hypothetical protein
LADVRDGLGGWREVKRLTRLFLRLVMLALVS